MTDEEYEDLITSYQFIINVQFTNTNQVKSCIEFCKAKERLSEDVLNYLLEKIQMLNIQSNTDSLTDSELLKPINSGLEITEGDENREAFGAIDNEGR